MNAFSKTKVNLSAAHELQEEKEDDSGISSCSKRPPKRSMSAKKLSEIFVSRLLTFVLSISILRKQEHQVFSFSFFYLSDKKRITTC